MQAAPDLLDRLLVLIKWLSAALGALVAGATFGPRAVIVGLVVLMGIDWITGFNRAYIAGEVSSEAGAKGLVKKGQILLLILAVHVLERLAGYEINAEMWGAGGFCVNEVISIIENVARSDVYIPRSIVQGLLKLRALRPEGATRAELDQLREETRVAADVALGKARVASDFALGAARGEADKLRDEDGTQKDPAPAATGTHPRQ